FFNVFSEDTVSLCLPFALLALKTLLPFAVAILSLKPCLFFLFLLEGWNVLFMIEYLYLIAPLTFLVLALTPKRTAKICTIFLNTNHCPTFVLSLNKKPMIYYQISCSNPASQFIELTLSMDIEDKSPVEIQLPAW